MSRAVSLAASIFIVALTTGALRAQTTLPKPPAGFMTLIGSVMDSIHGGPLVNATVSIEGTGRSSKTNADGEFRVDSIPPGSHRIVVSHPLLDTLGRPLITHAYPFTGGEAHTIDLFTPTGDQVAAALCPPAWRDKFGPAVMVGFVHDPDTNGPAIGAQVEVVFVGSDVLGRKQPAASRRGAVDSTGAYHVCGLPADMTGKVQVFRNGVSSGEVPVEVAKDIAVRSFTIVAHHQAIAEVKNDSGRVRKVAKGSARVTGVVIDKLGKPLQGARVALQGGGLPAISGSKGEFTLDSLPSGTQALDVRKLGYAATEVAVE
ncbi:MAG TPA: carboxypeptidase regulatory-like domain-containing protein, partial [Gemmatimonadaceae bacterium]|nr:carboxypeptidase regulatory-like domain-containing protein [Gemmatimonadaceae bacterium]